MPAPSKAGHEGWTLGKRNPPGLKEMTIEMGDSDIYVNMSRRIDLDNGHTLYEAVLTDPHGSRAIYIDRDDIVEIMRENFLLSMNAVHEASSDEPRPERRRTG
jgi:hypothetical protein